MTTPFLNPALTSVAATCPARPETGVPLRTETTVGPAATEPVVVLAEDVVLLVDPPPILVTTNTPAPTIRTVASNAGRMLLRFFGGFAGGFAARELPPAAAVLGAFAPRVRVA